MIKTEEVEAIATLLESEGEGGDIESLLRTSFPGMRFTFCSTDDIVVRRPVMELPNHEIYLYAGDHCLTLSNDYDAAHGVVVAEIED